MAKQPKTENNLDLNHSQVRSWNSVNPKTSKEHEDANILYVHKNARYVILWSVLTVLHNSAGVSIMWGNVNSKYSNTQNFFLKKDRNQQITPTDKLQRHCLHSLDENLTELKHTNNGSFKILAFQMLHYTHIFSYLYFLTCCMTCPGCSRRLPNASWDRL